MDEQQYEDVQMPLRQYLDEKFADVKSDIQEVKVAIFGNGRPGLNDRVLTLENGVRKSAGSWGVVGGIIAAIVAGLMQGLFK